MQLIFVSGDLLSFRSNSLKLKLQVFVTMPQHYEPGNCPLPMLIKQLPFKGVRVSAYLCLFHHVNRAFTMIWAPF